MTPDLFKLDIQQLRNTPTDASFRRILSEWLKDQTDWISVEERLPDHLQMILMYGIPKESSSTNPEIYSGAFNGAGGLNEFWTLGSQVKATHWKPRPNPPKPSIEDKTQKQ